MSGTGSFMHIEMIMDENGNKCVPGEQVELHKVAAQSELLVMYQNCRHWIGHFHLTGLVLHLSVMHRSHLH